MHEDENCKLECGHHKYHRRQGMAHRMKGLDVCLIQLANWKLDYEDVDKQLPKI